jgi:hypothetical protein
VRIRHQIEVKTKRMLSAQKLWIARVSLALSFVGCIFVIAAFSVLVLGRVTLGLFIIAVGILLTLPRLAVVANHLGSHSTLVFLGRLASSLRNRMLRTLLLYLSLFVYFEYFWYRRLSSQPSWFEAGHSSEANVNAMWSMVVFIVPFGGILLLAGLIVIPIACWYYYLDAKERKLGPLISTAVSIPSFITYFLSGSQLAFQLWTASTIVSILAWPSFDKRLSRKLSHAVEQMAVTSLCVLIMLAPFSMILPDRKSVV